MNKIKLLFTVIVIMLACAGCSVIPNNTLENRYENAETDKQITESEAKEEKADVKEGTAGNLKSDAFYGVWCYGGKSKEDAQAIASNLSDEGFNAEVFVTTDWENLNSEKFYVVTADVCATEEEAEEVLALVKEKGYASAYAKYTGERKE